VFGTLALSYDLLFGYVDLLSFGHALYFANGAYVFRDRADALARRAARSAGADRPRGFFCSRFALGAICLRMRDIPFAMVTLAFAEAGSILVMQNPLGLTGGEEGLALSADALPAALVGVPNTHNLYWIALALLIVAYAVARRAVDSPAGHVWQAIRENERRVAVLGLNPLRLQTRRVRGFPP